MLRHVCFPLLAFLSFTSARADTTRMVIEFGGGPAGENVYTVNSDGSFSSSTKLTVGSITISSVLAGTMEKGRLVQYRADETGATGDRTVLTFDHGKLHKKDKAGDVDLPLKLTDEPYFGNIQPQFCASAFAKVDFNKKTPQKITCFAPDVGVIMPISVTKLTEKTTTAGTARMFSVSLGPVEAKYAVDQAGHIVLMDVPAQKVRFIVQGWEGLVRDPLAAFPELSQSTFGVKVDKGVKMITRDGVTLVADVIRPDAPGRYPVILERTPYGRTSSTVGGPFYASRGYVFVSQDCRGRNDSGGEWDPFMHERKDGYDAVQWVAGQPWSDGNVGMIGGSYGGFVQWAAAVENPPALKCILPQVSPPDAFLNLPFDHGVFFLYGAVWWAKIVADKTADMSSVLSKLPHPERFGTLPLGKVDQAVLGRHIPFYAKWLSRTSAQDWKGWNYESDLSKVHIPALNISGWFDGDEIGTMINWQTMRDLGRTNQWLVYGPWSHAFNSATKIGDTDFGSTAVIDLDSVNLRWFDTWLKHKSVGFDKLPHVRAFVMGSNKWVESSDWPLAQSKSKTMYLSATGTVEGSASTGLLEARPPKKQAPSTYKFDPHTAVVGDQFLNPDPNKASMKFKLPKKAPGMALFETPPMTKAMAISGPITLDLRFSTSAENTDFFVNLADIDETGLFHATGQPGKIRCSYLNGFDKQRALVPGKIYEAKIRLWDRAIEIAKGHRLCIVLSSTAYPLFARNLGTIDPIATATRMVVQNQKIYHDAQNPSSITFHVIQR